MCSHRGSMTARLTAAGAKPSVRAAAAEVVAAEVVAAEVVVVVMAVVVMEKL